MCSSKLLLALTLVSCLASLCLTVPPIDNNSGQDNSDRNSDVDAPLPRGIVSQVITINESHSSNGTARRTVTTVETRSNGTRIRTTRTGNTVVSREVTNGARNGPGSRRRSAPQPSQDRDYVESDRDYQNLLDLLRRQAEEEEERKQAQRNFVPDEMSVDDIERLFAVASTEATIEHDSTATEEKEEGPEDCPICLDSMVDVGKSMPQCKHKFHTNCLGRWMSQEGDNNSKCPVCRSPILKTLKLKPKRDSAEK